MSALTELLPAATLRPSPLLLPLHRRVSVRQRRRREHRKNLRMLENGLLLTSSTRVSVLPPFPFFQNSTVLLNRSEVRLAGRGPEAGHGLGGRVDERRKLLDSEKHREPEGDHGRKVMETATARSNPTPLPAESPNFLTWYRGGGSRENFVAGLLELQVCNDLRAVLCALPDGGPPPNPQILARGDEAPARVGAGLAGEAPPLSAYAGGRRGNGIPRLGKSARRPILFSRTQSGMCGGRYHGLITRCL